MVKPSELLWILTNPFCDTCSMTKLVLILALKVGKHKELLVDVHPPKQTWNLKMDPWKRRFLLETIISRFHVNFWGCKLRYQLGTLWGESISKFCFQCRLYEIPNHQALKQQLDIKRFDMYTVYIYI